MHNIWYNKLGGMKIQGKNLIIRINHTEFSLYHQYIICEIVNTKCFKKHATHVAIHISNKNLTILSKSRILNISKRSKNYSLKTNTRIK